jgi:hypothetical protein
MNVAALSIPTLWLMPRLGTGGEVENEPHFEFACVHSEREI